MSNFVNIVFICIISSNFASGQSSLKYSYDYSTIVPVPDLSFLNKVYTGLDILEQMDFSSLKDKNIAILTNSTAVNRNSEHLLDILKRNSNINVSYLLAMEHGLWNTDDKRAKMMGRDNVDPVHNAPIIDLFDKYVYPPHWVMDKIDLVLVDFQITGSRYPTYLATMSKLFESASEFDVPVLILDRPNPLRGDIIDGPIPRTGYQSFEAYHLLPIRHGLTLGEVSLIINEMGWTKDSKRIKLSIIPVANWSRDMWYDETDLPWKTPIPPQINHKSLLFYCGMDLLRGTNLNMGFGTDMPYSIIGAPWLETSFLLEKINELSLPGVAFKALKYRPSGTIYQNRVPRYDGQSCSGIQLILKDRNLFNPLLTVTSLILLIEQLHPRHFKWEDGNYVDKLFGSNELTLFAAQKKSPIDLAAIWAMDVYKFSEFRKPFLLYK